MVIHLRWMVGVKLYCRGLRSGWVIDKWRKRVLVLHMEDVTTKGEKWGSGPQSNFIVFSLTKEGNISWNIMEYITSVHTSLKDYCCFWMPKCMYNANSTLPIQTYLIPKCLALAEPVSLTTFRINRKAKHWGQDSSRFKSMILKTCDFPYIAPRYSIHPLLDWMERTHTHRYPGVCSTRSWDSKVLRNARTYP